MITIFSKFWHFLIKNMLIKCICVLLYGAIIFISIKFISFSWCWAWLSSHTVLSHVEILLLLCSWCLTTFLVDSLHYWAEFGFKLLKLVIYGVSVCVSISFKPLEGFIRQILDVLFLVIWELLLQFFLV